MDQARTIGQDRQRGGFGPRQLGRAAAEVTPSGSLQPNHVTAERRVSSVQSQNLVLSVRPFQFDRADGFDQFFAPSSVGITTDNPHQLHGDRRGAALDAAGPYV